MNQGHGFRNRLDQSGDLKEQNDDLFVLHICRNKIKTLVFDTPGAWGRKGDDSGALITKQR